MQFFGKIALLCQTLDMPIKKDVLDDNKEPKVKVTGVIKAELQDTRYLVEIDVNGLKHSLVGYLSGRMRQNYIRVALGDKVEVEVSPKNLDLGRIVYKLDKNAPAVPQAPAA
jgi:translation initiation factor IF-1